MAEETWKTAITKIEPNKVAVRGYPIDQLMGRISFGEMVYLVLKGELPTSEIGRLMDAILVSSVDHGATPPSALAARTVASGGAPCGRPLPLDKAPVRRGRSLQGDAQLK